MTDKEFLTFIYERLKNVHNENELYDYMQRFKSYINMLPETQKTSWKYNF